eukprot:SAG25_NODE_1434_length_3030_cov_2.096213_1_plen_42_part_10
MLSAVRERHLRAASKGVSADAVATEGGDHPRFVVVHSGGQRR